MNFLKRYFYLRRFKFLMISLVLLVSPLSFSSEYSCKTKTGKPLDIFTLVGSSGLDATKSMKDTLGDRIYNEYMKFADNAVQKFPLFGLALKSINRFRWIPLYRFNCTKVGENVEQEAYSITGLEKAIIYSEEGYSVPPQFYVIKDLNDKSFDSNVKNEFKDKTRILALINEALRNSTFGTKNSLEVSRVSNLFYELVMENLNADLFSKKQLQINEIIMSEGARNLLAYTRAEFRSLRELMPQLTKVLVNFQNERQNVRDQIINECKSKMPSFSGWKLDETYINSYIELPLYQKNRDQLSFTCWYEKPFGGNEYEEIVLENHPLVELVRTMRNAVDSIYDSFLPSYFVQKGRKYYLTSKYSLNPNYQIGLVGYNRTGIYNTIYDSFYSDIELPELITIKLHDYGFNKKLAEFKKSSAIMTNQIDQLLSGKEVKIYDRNGSDI